MSLEKCEKMRKECENIIESPEIKEELKQATLFFSDGKV